MTQTLLSLVDQHLLLAYTFLFAVCLGEALFIIGLFVPSTVVLIAVGAMIGGGKLPFLPVLVVAAAGATAGDALSYAIGHHYRDRLRTVWPFRRYGTLIERGEAFFHRHGGKSVFLGRFVPGVKAIVPGIAGMVGMGVVRFTSVNVVSAFVWAAAHLIPAAGIGIGLSRVHSLDPRLAILLVGAIAVLLLAWYVGKIAIAFVWPVAADWRRVRIERRANSTSRLARLELRYLSNDDNIVGRTAIMVVAALAAAGFLLLLGNLLFDPELKLADKAVYNFLQSYRSDAGTKIVTAITMAADGFVLTSLTVALVLWLAIRRHIRVAIAAALAMAGSELFVHLVKGTIERPRPTDLYAGVSSFSFPSGHATLSMTFFGILAVIVASHMKPGSRPIVLGIAALAALTVAFSRLYLGAHWLTDVSAGMSFGILMAAVFALTTHLRDRTIRLVPLVAVLMVVFGGSYGFHLWRDYGTWTRNYAPMRLTTDMSKDAWLKDGWKSLASHRLTMGGDAAGPILFQTDLDVAELAPLLASAGWSPTTTGGLAEALLPATGALSERATLPLLHEGRMPVATFTRPSQDGRDVLTLWPSAYRIGPDGGERPILLAGYSKEELDPFVLGLAFVAVQPEAVPPDAVTRPLAAQVRARPTDLVSPPSGSAQRR